MTSHQSLVAVALGSFFGTPALSRSIRTNVCFNLFAESNGAPDIVSTAKLSGACVTDRSAVRRTLLSHALPSTSVVDLVVIGSVKVHKDFFHPPIPTFSNMSGRVKPCSHWATCVRMGSMREIPR